MPRTVLEEARQHPAIREKIANLNADIVHNVQAAATTNAVLVVGMAGNPWVRRARKSLDRRRRRPPIPRIRQLFRRMAKAQFAEDVDRLADLSDGLPQGHPSRRRRAARGLDRQRRIETHPGRMTPRGRRLAVAALVARAPRRSSPAARAAERPSPAAMSPASPTACCAAASSARSTRTIRRRDDDHDPVRRRSGDGPAQARRSGLHAGRRPGPKRRGVAAQTMPLFARLNNRRDIVFVDQRGTGARRRSRATTTDETLADQSEPIGSSGA